MTVCARRWLALAALGPFCALGLGACADTIQDQPAPPNALEPLVLQEAFPVYWLGGTFQGLAITRVGRDPGGAYEIQYGNCTIGGQSTCVTPLELVTSPDNGFLPGGDAAQRPVLVRGASGRAALGGKALMLATGGVVVDLYADSATLARAAAEAMVSINAPAAGVVGRSNTGKAARLPSDLPGAPLPPPLPNTGYGERPLPAQQPALAPTGWESALR